MQLQHMHTHLKIIPTKRFDAEKLIMQQLTHLKVTEVCLGGGGRMGDGEENKEQNDVTLSLVPLRKVSH
jgi:hypothetical protein